MTQSRSRAVSAWSPACLLAENEDGCSRSTPIAEKWITRRTPACSQAVNSAAAASACTSLVFSDALS